MKTQDKSEKGQAIVMIAFAIVGLFALVALAMDGGHSFSDRREAQNAADAAALAAARRYAQDYTVLYPEYQNIVWSNASTNGYTNDGTLSVVTLAEPYPPAVADQCSAMAGYEGRVFQVDIVSNLPTWFGGVIGVSETHNHVTSYALGCRPYYADAYNGNAVVVLNKHDCQALKFSGSSTTTVTSSTSQGLYVRSACMPTPPDEGSPQNALYVGSGSVIAPNVNVVGGIYNPGRITIYPAGGQVKIGVAPLDELYKWPEVDEPGVCPPSTPDAARTVPNGDTLTPGVYPGGNPDFAHESTFPPNGVKHLNSGVYCLDKDFKITSGDLGNILGDGGVTIVQRNGIISISGGGIITLYATASGPLKGLLFYLPKSNPISDPTNTLVPAVSTGINIQGNGASLYDGSIVAPGAHISIAGGSGTSAPFQTQLVGDTVSIGGTGDIALNYDSGQLYLPPISASVKLLK